MIINFIFNKLHFSRYNLTTTRGLYFRRRDKIPHVDNTPLKIFSLSKYIYKLKWCIGNSIYRLLPCLLVYIYGIISTLYFHQIYQQKSIILYCLFFIYFMPRFRRIYKFFIKFISILGKTYLTNEPQK